VKYIVRAGVRLAVVLTAFLITACATRLGPSVPIDAENPYWQGRLSLKIETAKAQAFSADFALQGSANAGSLTFTSPLGSTLARLQWSAAGASLQANGTTERFESLAELTRRATGADLPIASLFSWLNGRDVFTPGWEADLQSLPSGRLTAKRLGPDAPAELKIILDP
jgi:outer membrane lipoprotein LolB